MARRALLLVALIFRLPILLQAPVNSDGAVIGLQGLHMLRGEFSNFLWRSPYQSPAEPAVAALFEKLLGANPLALATGPTVEALLLCWLVHRLLSRHLGEWPAAVAALPLAVPVLPLFVSITYSIRGVLGLAVMTSIALADSADKSAPRIALASGLAVFCVYIDLYALEVLPALLLFAAIHAWPERRRLAAAAAGAVAAVPLVLLLRLHGDVGILGAGPHYSLAKKLSLLFQVCLPAAAGGYWHHIDSSVVGGAGWLRWPAVIVLCLGVASGALLAPMRRIPRGVRLLGICGSLLAALSVGAFLVSSMPEDLWSARYLVSLLWGAPLALAPLAWLLGPGRLLVGLAPWLVSASIAAAIALEMPARFTKPPLPLEGLTSDERALRDFLRARGIRAALSGYWTSYRLTFLFGEWPVVAPLSPSEDRYPPYRALVGPHTAVIASGGRADARFGPYSVLLLDRPPPR